MKVIIKEREHDYFSDYPNGWLFASGDPYKFPVSIGKYTCFVKRFEKKSPEDISGWKLLVQLKGKFDPNLPRIYDVVEAEENNKLIHYIFYEFLTGETLEAAVSRNADLSLRRLTDDLFNAVEALRQRDFWFSDFCEKNIFKETNGRFLLIDLDSVQPVSQVPHNNMYGDKQYWALVFNFYKEHLGYKDLKPSDISGPMLNYLQMIFLVLRLKIALVDKRYDYKSAELYDNLPDLLQDTDPGFKDIFVRALEESQQGVNLLPASEVKEFIFQQIIDNDQVPYQPTRREPLIVAFAASSTQAEPGNPISLAWEVKHASRLELYRNNALYKEIHPATNTLELKEGYDGKTKKVVYTLRAANHSGEQISEPVMVTIAEKASEPVMAVIAEETSKPVIFTKAEVIPPPILIDNNQTPEPIIKFFRASTAQVVGGQSFSIDWEVEHATRLELYRNDQRYHQLPLTQNSLEIKEEYDATSTTVTYALVAANNYTEQKSEPLAITFIKPILPNPRKLRLIRLALLVSFLAIVSILGVVAYGILVRKQIEIAALRKRVTEGDTLVIPGKNFPGPNSIIQVFFNKQPGTIIARSENRLQVLVPFINIKTDSTRVKVALLVKNDTIYTPDSLTVKRNTEIAGTVSILPPENKTLGIKSDSAGAGIKKQVLDTPADSVPDSIVKTKSKKTDNSSKTGSVKSNKTTKNQKESSSKIIRNGSKSAENTQSYNSSYQSEQPKVDISKLVTIKSNVLVNQRRDGTKNLQITVQNSSPYDLDSVSVEVNYMKKNRRFLKKEVLTFHKIRAHTSQTLAAPDEERGRRVDFKIVSLYSKQLY